MANPRFQTSIGPMDATAAEAAMIQMESIFVNARARKLEMEIAKVSVPLKVVDELKLDITASERIIFQATLESMQEENLRTDTEHVSAMIDEYRAGGLAAVGTHDVLLALANGQVDTLFVCTELEQIHPGKEDLHRALAPAVAELPAGAGVQVTDALVRQAYQTGARVRFIEDPALLANVGGVGATLRFRF
ncbi:MAG: hypothetical protein LC130_11230 [Bryobacterales bacterium]|nr:hypothetical protein [Bryobacterales bacterium]